MGYSEAQYAIDGIISGLNGQAKTGLEPPNVNFSVIAGNQSAKIRFTATDTIIADMVLASTKGLTIRRKIGSAPTGPNDGDLVGTYEGIELISHVGNNPIIDSHLINGQRYYYRFFPYTGEMVYNYSSRNIISIVPKSSTIWGFHQDFSNLDPDSSITYIEDAVGYIPAHHNEDTGTVTNGTWGEWEWLNMNKPYVVSGGGQAIYALDPNDFSKKIDGTASNIDSLSGGTGCFSWINKIYMKEVYATNGLSRDVYFSMDNTSPDTLDFKPVGFEADENTVLEGIWLPMFYGDVDGCVKPGTLPAFTDNNQIKPTATNRIPNIKTMETTIKAGFGANGYFLGGPIINVLRDILYLIYKSTNVRKHGGEGRIKADAIVVNHADTQHDGQFYGRNRSAGLVNRMFYSEVLNSFQFPIIDPYTCMSIPNYSDSIWSYEMMPYYTKQATLKEHTSETVDYSWNNIMDTYPQSNFIYSDSDHGVYSLTSGLSDFNVGDTGITESRFNNGYGVYVPTKLVMMTENISATHEEEIESGLSYAARVDYDVIAGSVKNNHGRPTGSVVRMDAHGSAASANLGLCSAVLTADYGGSYRNGGMALRFGGCLDYTLEPPASPSDSRFDFNYGQLGGDYAGIAYLAFLNVGNSFLNSGRAVKGGGWGYSILALPPSGYSPVEI